MSQGSSSSHLAYLRAQQRVNAMQDYTRFKSGSSVSSLNASKTVGYGNRGAQGSTLLSPSHPAMNPSKSRSGTNARCPGKKPGKR